MEEQPLSFPRLLRPLRSLQMKDSTASSIHPNIRLIFLPNLCSPRHPPKSLIRYHIQWCLAPHPLLPVIRPYLTQLVPCSMSMSLLIILLGSHRKVPPVAGSVKSSFITGELHIKFIVAILLPVFQVYMLDIHGNYQAAGLFSISNETNHISCGDTSTINPGVLALLRQILSMMLSDEKY